MLVRFHTPSHGTITYSGNIGVSLLHMMGRSGNVPGALDAEHVPAALEKLKHELAMQQEEDHVPTNPDAAGKEEVVALSTRAFPLIELLEAAIAEDDYVSWE